MTNNRLFGLDGRVAAIIGAGSGIGEAVALGCARQGATICCLDIDAEAATRTAAVITNRGETADAAVLDVTDAAAVSEALQAAADRYGSLDIVICTPGVNVANDWSTTPMPNSIGL